MRLRVHFKEEQDFKVDLKQSNTVLHSDFGEIITIPENNYNNLTNKPSINGVELIGNKTGEDLDLGSAVFPSGGQPGDFLGLDNDSEVAWITPEPATIDYNDLQNQPQINGVTLSGDKSAQELGLATPSDIPSLTPYRTAAEQDVIDAAQNVVINTKYVKPNGGIPLSDLSSDVQASLSKADHAVTLEEIENYYVNVTLTSEDRGYADTTIGEVLAAINQNKRVLFQGELGADFVTCEVTSTSHRIQGGVEEWSLQAVAVAEPSGILYTVLYPWGPASSAEIEVHSRVIEYDLSIYRTRADQDIIDNGLQQQINNVVATALPSGGEAGQLLMKTSNVDYITEWVSPANEIEQDNTRPITAGAVYSTVGNIQQLLSLI